jgi:hypothetical protein
MTAFLEISPAKVRHYGTGDVLCRMVQFVSVWRRTAVERDSFAPGNIPGNLYCRSDFRMSSGKSSKAYSQSAVKCLVDMHVLGDPRLMMHRGQGSTYGCAMA